MNLKLTELSKFAQREGDRPELADRQQVAVLAANNTIHAVLPIDVQRHDGRANRAGYAEQRQEGGPNEQVVSELKSKKICPVLKL